MDCRDRVFDAAGLKGENAKSSGDGEDRAPTNDRETVAAVHDLFAWVNTSSSFGSVTPPTMRATTTPDGSTRNDSGTPVTPHQCDSATWVLRHRPRPPVFSAVLAHGTGVVAVDDTDSLKITLRLVSLVKPDQIRVLFAARDAPRREVIHQHPVPPHAGDVDAVPSTVSAARAGARWPTSGESAVR